MFLLFKYVCRFCFLYLPPVSASVPVSAASVLYCVPVFNVLPLPCCLPVCFGRFLASFLFLVLILFVLVCLFTLLSCFLPYSVTYLLLFFEGYYHIAVFLFLLALEIGMGG